jgi:hypothetical protein
MTRFFGFVLLMLFVFLAGVQLVRMGYISNLSWVWLALPVVGILIAGYMIGPELYTNALVLRGVGTMFVLAILISAISYSRGAWPIFWDSVSAQFLAWQVSLADCQPLGTQLRLGLQERRKEAEVFADEDTLAKIDALELEYQSRKIDRNQFNARADQIFNETDSELSRIGRLRLKRNNISGCENGWFSSNSIVDTFFRFNYFLQLLIIALLVAAVVGLIGNSWGNKLKGFFKPLGAAAFLFLAGWLWLAQGSAFALSRESYDPHKYPQHRITRPYTGTVTGVDLTAANQWKCTGFVLAGKAHIELTGYTQNPGHHRCGPGGCVNGAPTTGLIEDLWPRDVFIGKINDGSGRILRLGGSADLDSTKHGSAELCISVNNLAGGPNAEKAWREQEVQINYEIH